MHACIPKRRRGGPPEEENKLPRKSITVAAAPYLFASPFALVHKASLAPARSYVEADVLSKRSAWNRPRNVLAIRSSLHSDSYCPRPVTARCACALPSAALKQEIRFPLCAAVRRRDKLSGFIVSTLAQSPGSDDGSAGDQRNLRHHDALKPSKLVLMPAERRRRHCDCFGFVMRRELLGAKKTQPARACARRRLLALDEAKAVVEEGGCCPKRKCISRHTAAAPGEAPLCGANVAAPLQCVALRRGSLSFCGATTSTAHACDRMACCRCCWCCCGCSSEPTSKQHQTALLPPSCGWLLRRSSFGICAARRLP